MDNSRQGAGGNNRCEHEIHFHAIGVSLPRNTEKKNPNINGSTNSLKNIDVSVLIPSTKVVANIENYFNELN